MLWVLVAVRDVGGGLSTVKPNQEAARVPISETVCSKLKDDFERTVALETPSREEYIYLRQRVNKALLHKGCPILDAGGRRSRGFGCVDLS